MNIILPILAFLLIAAIAFGIGAVMLSAVRILSGKRVFGALTPMLAYMFRMNAKQYDSLQSDVRRAGFYAPFAMEDFLAVRNVVLAGWIMFVAAAVLGARPEGSAAIILFAIGFVGFVMLFSVPRLWIQARGNRRVEAIQSQMPDVLDMLAMCMSGGMPLLQSFQRVVNELGTSHPELAAELQIVEQQAESHTLTLAMDQFASRINVDETRTLAALVAQSERLGTNLAEAFQEYADGVRRSFRQRAEEQGNKASVKLLLPVSFCLAPPVYILLLAPALLELRDFVQRENAPGGVLSQAADNLDQYSTMSDDIRGN